MPGLIKPARWAVTPALVDPKWGWAHDKLLMSLPFWDISGNDLAKPRNVLSVQLGTPLMVASRRGVCVDFDGAEALGVPRIDVNDGSFTIGCVFELDIFGTGGNQDILFRQGNINSVGYLLEVENSRLFGRAVTNAVVTVNDLVVGVTYATIWTFADSIDTGRLVVLGSDGSFENRFSTILTTAFSNGPDATSNIGGRVTADFSDGRIYCLDLWDKFLSEEQCLQWVRDPFGMYRMLDEVGVVIVPAVVGGVSDYHYRQRYFG